MVKTNGVAIPMQLAIPKASTSASSSSTSKSKTCTSTSSSSTSKLKVSTSISNKSKSANHVKSKKSTSSERRQLYFVNPEKTGLVEKLTKHSSHNGGSKQKPGLISSKKRKSKHESDSDTDVDDDDDDDDDLDFGDFEETYRKSKKTKSDSKRSATSKRSTSKSSNPYIVIDDSGSDLELRQTPNRKKSSEGRSSMEISRSNSNNSVDIDDLQDMYIGQLSTAANTPITPTDNQLQQSTLFSTSFNSSPESS